MLLSKDRGVHDPHSIPTLQKLPRRSIRCDGAECTSSTVRKCTAATGNVGHQEPFCAGQQQETRQGFPRLNFSPRRQALRTNQNLMLASRHSPSSSTPHIHFKTLPEYLAGKIQTAVVNVFSR